MRTNIATPRALRLAVIAALLAVACPAAQPTAEVTVKVTTFNILSSSYDDQFPNNTWAQRKAAVRDIIKHSYNAPEIFGVQESQIGDQINDLKALMGTTYSSYVSSMGISPRAIFWKNDKYSLLASNTIDILGSAYSGHNKYRYASYVRLKCLANNKALMIFNIHLPWGATEEFQEIRYVAANILAGKVKQYSEDFGDIPAIVLGDLNTYPGTVVAGIPAANTALANNGLVDTYGATADRMNPNYGTKNNMVNATAYSGTNGSKRLDYLFVYPPGNVTVLDWRNIIDFVPGSTTNLETPVPSDHNPVRSRLTLYWFN